MSEILLTIARVRRAMPRNVDVMAVCDECERLLVVQAPPGVQSQALTQEAVEAAKFDKKAYQRELMRKRRQKEKAK